MRRFADGSSARVITVAVLGVDSMLGKELVRQLRGNNQSVISIGRAPHNDIAFDLTTEFKPETCNGLKADILIHCASAFAGDDGTGAKINFLTNTLGCLNVLMLMEALECRHCCYAGAVTSFDDFESIGMNSYGLSKVQGEQILEWGMKKVDGLFCSLRLTGLYDVEGDCCRHQPWLGRIVAYASRGLDIRLPPSVGKRNYLHVSDAARLMIHSVNTRITGCWPVCHTECHNHTEIAELAYAEFARGGKVFIEDKKNPFRQVNYPDSNLFYEKLGDAPRVSMAQGLTMIHRSGFVERFGPMDVQ